MKTVEMSERQFLWLRVRYLIYGILCGEGAALVAFWLAVTGCDR